MTTSSRLIVSLAILLVALGIFGSAASATLVSIPNTAVFAASDSCLDGPAACIVVTTPSDPCLVDPASCGGVPIPPAPVPPLADPCLVDPAACGGVPVPPPPAPIPDAPPEPVDNAPSASIAVPRTAAPGSQLSIAVTGTDDNDVAQLQFFDASNNLLSSFNCVGVQAICSSTFTATAPATQNTAYTFKARSVDNAGQPSAFAVGTGTTTAIPVPPAPVSVSVSILPRPSVRFPLQSLFMRSVSFPDSDCVMPGESALLAVKIQNTGKTTLKGVSFTATVQEAGIYARSGPVSITTKGRMNRFLRIDVPDDTVEGDYYLRLTVANSRFSRTVHRVFTVGSSC